MISVLSIYSVRVMCMCLFCVDLFWLLCVFCCQDVLFVCYLVLFVLILLWI